MQAKYEGVWMLSEGVRMVSGRCMRWKQFETDWKQLYKYHGIQILLFLLVASCRPIMGVSGWCLRVSCIVWMVSEHVWQMTGVGRCHINWEQLNKYHGIQISLFLPVASCRPNMRVSVGCLDVVWGCQDGVWVCQADVWGENSLKQIENSYINIMVFRYYYFS